MSKNLTRKGLAIGAVVALGTTLIAGSPAFAASVLFAPSTGTGNTLVAGETFSLTASLSSDLPASNSTQLKFKVANTTGVAATVTLNSKLILANAATAVAADVTAGSVSPVALDASVGGTTAGSTLTSTTTSAVYGIGSAVAAGAVAGTASAATNPTTIKIASTAGSTASYTVTAFLDANNNGAVDTGELSTAQTINFVKIADSGLTTTFTKPSIASGALKAALTFAADVNVAQLNPANYSVAYGLYGTTGKIAVIGSGTAFTSSTVNTGDVVDNYNATDFAGKLISNATATTAPTSGATYSAQPVFGAALVASEVFQVVAASADADATALTVAPTVSNDVVQVGVTAVYNVRSGVAASAVKATIKKTPVGGTATAVGAGVVVNVTVSAPVFGRASGATVDDTITVNGVAVTAANVGTYATTVVTDATGVVTVPVVTSSGAAANSITVTLTVANAVNTATGGATLTWLAASLVAPVDLIVGSNAPVHVVAKGGNFATSYALTDNYKALYTGSAYRLVFTAPGAAGSTAPTSQTTYVPFVNGVATVSITDNSTGAGVNAASYIVEKLTDGLWSQAAAPLNTTVTAPFTVKAIAQVASAVTATGPTTDTREIAATFAAVDQRVAFNTTKAPTGFTAGSDSVIAGQVTDASGVGVAGAKVTIAAAGIQFVAGTVYAVGSITVSADATGNYTVTAYSHTAGKVTYTVTSGAATKTVAVTYEAVSGSAGTVLTLTAPTTVLPGRTLTVTGLLVDKFGNPVVTTSAAAAEFTVDYDGPGLVVGNDITATSSTGTFTLRVLLGAADSGTATVTATYGGANGTISSADTGANIDIVKTVTVTIGAAAVVAPKAAVIATKNGRVYVTVNSPAGFSAAVKVGFSQKPAFRTTGSKLVSYFVGSGKRVAVVVTLRGGVVASQAITVK